MFESERIGGSSFFVSGADRTTYAELPKLSYAEQLVSTKESNFDPVGLLKNQLEQPSLETLGEAALAVGTASIVFAIAAKSGLLKEIGLKLSDLMQGRSLESSIALFQKGVEAAKSPLETKLAASVDQSVYRAKSAIFNDKGYRYFGTAFAVDKSRLGTAFHVVADEPIRPWQLQNRLKETLNAKVVAGHPGFDLALFETLEKKELIPMPLRKQLLEANELQSGFIVGAPGGHAIEMRAAQFRKGLTAVGNDYRTERSWEHSAGFLPTVAGGKASRGMSGGPAIQENGEVLGVLQSANFGLPRLFGLGTSSVPSTAMTKLLEMVEKAKVPGAAMNLSTAADELRIAPKKLVEQLQRGKIAGFLVPKGSSQADAHWDWIVLRPKS